MLLSEIYDWMFANFTYFKPEDRSWRNSVRHNLSLNECFIKQTKSEGGQGSHWIIHPANVEDFAKGDFQRRKARRKVRQAEMKSQENAQGGTYGSGDTYIAMSVTTATVEDLITTYGKQAIIGDTEKLAVLEAYRPAQTPYIYTRDGGSYHTDKQDNHMSIHVTNASTTDIGYAASVNSMLQPIIMSPNKPETVTNHPDQSVEFSFHHMSQLQVPAERVPQVSVEDHSALESGLAILSEALSMNAEDDMDVQSVDALSVSFNFTDYCNSETEGYAYQESSGTDITEHYAQNNVRYQPY